MTGTNAQAIIQTVVSMLSIAAGVAIAVFSFRANRKSEHRQWIRNRKAEHEQWLRDQAKAEWKDILEKIAELEHEIPIVVSGIPDHRGLERTILRILPLLRSTLFV